MELFETEDDVEPSGSGSAESTDAGWLSGGGEQAASDDKPKRKRSQAATEKSEDRELQKALTVVVTKMSVPFAMVGDEFCAWHFENNGPPFVEEWVDASKRHPAFRQWLERLAYGGGDIKLGITTLMFLAPPILHHLDPNNRSETMLMLKQRFGIPLVHPHAPGPYSGDDGDEGETEQGGYQGPEVAEEFAAA